jgi:anaerobic ribonucleoside-triphosphate reductase
VGRKQGKRLLTAILPSQATSERFAQLDIEKYGLAKTVFSGDREKPFYSTVDRFRVEGSGSLNVTSVSTEITRIEGLRSGGGLTIVELNEPEYKPEELMNLTDQLIGNQSFEFFTYKRRISYCSNCQKSYVGSLNKCPGCGAVSSLTVFDRFSYT